MAGSKAISCKVVIIYRLCKVKVILSGNHSGQYSSNQVLVLLITSFGIGEHQISLGFSVFETELTMLSCPITLKCTLNAELICTCVKDYLGYFSFL